MDILKNKKNKTLHETKINNFQPIKNSVFIFGVLIFITYLRH